MQLLPIGQCPVLGACHFFKFSPPRRAPLFKSVCYRAVFSAKIFAPSHQRHRTLQEKPSCHQKIPPLCRIFKTFSPITILQYLCTYLLSPVSRLLSHVSCFTSPDSSPVFLSCLTSSVSYLLSRVSRLLCHGLTSCRLVLVSRSPSLTSAVSCAQQSPFSSNLSFLCFNLEVFLIVQ